MSTLNDLACCMAPEDTIVAAPENRADCGPCIWSSGIVKSSEALKELASGMNKSAEFPYRKPLEFKDPLMSVPCVDSATGTNAAGIAPIPGCNDCISVCESSFRAVKQFTSQCWTEDEIHSMCTPIMSSVEEYIMDHISSEYWIRALFENQILGSLDGIINDNIANDGADMVVDVINNPVPTPDGSATTTGFNSNAHAYAEAQIGCANTNIAGIIMHKDLFFRRLRIAEGANCSIDVYDSERLERSPMLRGQGSAREYRYNGYPVYVCDHPLLKDATDPANPVYKTYYFGDGLFQFGSADLMRRNVKPFHVEYEACTNGGYGATKWISRVGWVLHPVGFNNNWSPGRCAAAAGIPEAEYTHMRYSDLSNPVSWNRSWERLNIPLVAVISN